MNELLKLLGLAEDEEHEDESVADALKKKYPAVYQAVFDAGHGVAKAQDDDKLKKLQADLKTAQADLKAAKTELTQLKQSQPDTAQLQGEIDELEAKVKELEGTLETERVAHARGSVVDKFRAKLAARLNDGYEEVILLRPEVQAAIELTEDKKVRILRPGRKTPYAGDTEDAQLDALVADVLKDVKPVYKRPTVTTPGSGTEEAHGDGGPQDEKQVRTKLFEKVAEEAKRSNGPAPTDLAGELNRRLGLNTSRV